MCVGGLGDHDHSKRGITLVWSAEIARSSPEDCSFCISEKSKWCAWLLQRALPLLTPRAIVERHCRAAGSLRVRLAAAAL